MKQLQPVLQVLNNLILEQLQVGLQLVPGDNLEVNTTISRMILGLQDGGTDNGLTIEDLKIAVEGLKLPSSGDPSLSATVRVDEVTLKFDTPLWGRAATLAKEPMVGNLGKLLDRIHVRKLKVKVDLDPVKIVDIEVWLEHVEITLAGRSGVTVDDIHLRLEDFDIKEKDKKAALKQARVVLQSVTTRVSQEFLNRAVDVARAKIPSLVQSLNFDLASGAMLVTSKLSIFPMAIPTELTFNPEDNLFGIYIVKVAIGLARPVILGLVKSFASNRPEVKVQDNRLCINPWGKIPVPVVCKLSDFAVRDRHVVVGFSPPASIPERPRHKKAAEAVVDKPAQEAEPVRFVLPPLP